MIFTAQRGRPFKEEFSFKNANGRAIQVPTGRYVVRLEYGGVVREITDLRVTRNKIFWTMDSDEVDELGYETMYFTLHYNGQEISRGVLKIQ